MDDGFPEFVLFLVAVFFFVFVILAAATGGFQPNPYCPAGQAEIKDGQGNITQCVIFPPPVPPGYVLPPGTPAPSPVFVAPLNR